MVVSGGHTCVAMVVSSNPQMDIVARNRHARFRGRPDRTDGHVVVAREDGGRPLRQRQQLAHGCHARLEGEPALHHVRRVLLQSGAREAVAVAGQAPDAGAVFQIANDVGDAAVAERYQVFHHRRGGFALAQHHADAVLGMVARRDRGERHALPVQAIEQLRMIGERRREDQPVGPVPRQDVLDALDEVRRRGDQRLHHHAVVLRLACFQHAGLHFHDVAGRTVVVQQADHEGAIGRQAARRGERPVVERGDGIHHALAHGVAHVRIIVEHPRDGLLRCSNGTGDVVDGHARHESLALFNDCVPVHQAGWPAESAGLAHSSRSLRPPASRSPAPRSARSG